MGQKINPLLFRVSGGKSCRSKACWFASRLDFARVLGEDIRIRAVISSRPSCKDVVDLCISRKGGGVFVLLCVLKMGPVIGKQGAEIAAIKGVLFDMLNKPIEITVEEEKNVGLSATCMAKQIVAGIERRERAMGLMRESGRVIMRSGALGFKIRISGRHGGADMARDEEYKSGKVPLHTIDADIDYCCMKAMTTYGVMGVSVWINNGKHPEIDYSSEEFSGSNFAYMAGGKSVKSI